MKIKLDTITGLWYKLHMDDSVKKYLSEIGRKGGKISKRTWTPEQRERMVKKLIETLRKKKEIPIV